MTLARGVGDWDTSGRRGLQFILARARQVILVDST